MDDAAQPGMGMDPAATFGRDGEVDLRRTGLEHADVARLDSAGHRLKAKRGGIGHPAVEPAQAQRIAGWEQDRFADLFQRSGQQANTVKPGGQIAAMEPPRTAGESCSGLGQGSAAHCAGLA